MNTPKRRLSRSNTLGPAFDTLRERIIEAPSDIDLLDALEIAAQVRAAQTTEQIGFAEHNERNRAQLGRYLAGLDVAARAAFVDPEAELRKVAARERARIAAANIKAKFNNGVATLQLDSAADTRDAVLLEASEKWGSVKLRGSESILRKAIERCIWLNIRIAGATPEQREIYDETRAKILRHLQAHAPEATLPQDEIGPLADAPVCSPHVPLTIPMETLALLADEGWLTAAKAQIAAQVQKSFERSQLHAIVSSAFSYYRYYLRSMQYVTRDPKARYIYEVMPMARAIARLEHALVSLGCASIEEARARFRIACELRPRYPLPKGCAVQWTRKALFFFRPALNACKGAAGSAPAANPGSASSSAARELFEKYDAEYTEVSTEMEFLLVDLKTSLSLYLTVSDEERDVLIKMDQERQAKFAALTQRRNELASLRAMYEIAGVDGELAFPSWFTQDVADNGKSE